MSLTGPDFWPEKTSILVTAGAACFYCHQPTVDPAVVWSGATSEIYLHPRCVVEFTIRLYRDLHQLERATGRKVTELKG